MTVEYEIWVLPNPRGSFSPLIEHISVCVSTQWLAGKVLKQVDQFTNGGTKQTHYKDLDDDRKLHILKVATWLGRPSAVVGLIVDNSEKIVLVIFGTLCHSEEEENRACNQAEDVAMNQQPVKRERKDFSHETRSKFSESRKVRGSKEGHP